MWCSVGVHSEADYKYMREFTKLPPSLASISAFFQVFDFVFSIVTVYYFGCSD